MYNVRKQVKYILCDKMGKDSDKAELGCIRDQEGSLVQQSLLKSASGCSRCFIFNIATQHNSNRANCSCRHPSTADVMDNAEAIGNLNKLSRNWEREGGWWHTTSPQ